MKSKNKSKTNKKILARGLAAIMVLSIFAAIAIVGVTVVVAGPTSTPTPTPTPPPVPVPEFSAIGLLALIGILSVVLATIGLMKRK